MPPMALFFVPHRKAESTGTGSVGTNVFENIFAHENGQTTGSSLVIMEAASSAPSVPFL